MNIVFGSLGFLKSSDTNAPSYNLHTYLQFVPFDLLINAYKLGKINIDLPNCKKSAEIVSVLFCFL